MQMFKVSESWMNGTVTMSHAVHYVFAGEKEEVISHCQDMEMLNEDSPFMRREVAMPV